MNINYLPTEDDKTYSMFAYCDTVNDNKVYWTGVNNDNSYMDRVSVAEHSQFLVWRRGNLVIVEGCGWYGPEFKYRLELTDTPDRVVALAAWAADLMESLPR